MRIGSRNGWRLLCRAIVPAIALLAMAGCSDSNDDNSGGLQGTTTYEGTLVGPGDSGALEVTIAPAAAAPAGSRVVAAATYVATGQLTLMGGCAIDLNGTFDGMTLTIAGTGTCGSFTLVGVVGSGRIEGTFTGPAGRTGTFVIVLKGSSDTVSVFCGSWVEMESGTPTGTTGPWNMIIKGSSLAGVAYTADSEAIPLTGSVNGNDVTIRVAVNDQQIATGTIDGSSISGDYDIGTSAGTWSGGTCQ